MASGYWASPRAQMEGMLSSDNRFSGLEDSVNSVDAYAGWCSSPLALDQMFASYAFSPMNYASLDAFTGAEQSSVGSFVTEGDAVLGSFNGGKMMFQQENTQFVFPMDSVDGDGSGAKKGDRESSLCQQNRISDVDNSMITRSLEQPLAEKMLKALALFQESSGAGILAQVWVPIRHGDHYMLSTCQQPYLLDQVLAGYREVSRGFTFSLDMKPGSFSGLPGRVFVSKVPEWTSNVVYYNKDEYLRVQDAVKHEVRGAIALPVFDGDPLKMSCCAVLELVTTKEKPDFDAEIEGVCRALKAVDLRSTAPPRLNSKCLSENQRAALAEITDVLQAVCHAHSLPLALTWIPCSYNEQIGDENIKVCVRGCNTNSVGKWVLCVEETACYVNDREMQGFVHACSEHYLEEGQGVAGKALQSIHPFFFPDVKGYDINAYPLVHHARKFDLHAAVAIRLRSAYTGDDDYILEFFLPVNMTESTEQQLLLNNLSTTMLSICRSLRMVSDSELVGGDSKLGLQNELVSNLLQVTSSRSISQQALLDRNLKSIDHALFNISDSSSTGMEKDGTRKKRTGGSRRQMERKRSTSEKTVSLSVLQQYFCGSLKDAAKSIGVCPTTLKRICRQYGISRWPSRKINKVNRSLRKIQTVLDSVQGVEGGLKFDPATGGLVAASSIIQDFDPPESSFFPSKRPVKTPEPVAHLVSVPPELCIEGQSYRVKLEEECCYMDGLKLDSSESQFISQSSSSMAAAVDEMNTSMTFDIGIDSDDDDLGEHNRPGSSDMTESSNGSMMNGSSSSSPSFGGQKNSRTGTRFVDSGSKITVKATYKEDTVRFKFEPSVGCIQLYEEVAKRFKLQTGTFQLKYYDDDEEWVMLVTDSDLQECIEILDSLGTRSVKFLVQDAPFAMGSSGSSS